MYLWLRSLALSHFLALYEENHLLALLVKCVKSFVFVCVLFEGIILNILAFFCSFFLRTKRLDILHSLSRRVDFCFYLASNVKFCVVVVALLLLIFLNRSRKEILNVHQATTNISEFLFFFCLGRKTGVKNNRYREVSVCLCV